MAFQTERIQIDGSLNVDGSIFQYGVEFTGGGGGGGTGDVAWASGSVGSNNQIITAAGDGSIVADPSITFSGTILQIGTQNQHATDSQIIIDRSDDGQAEIRFIGKDSDPGWTAGTGCTAGSMIPGNFYIHNLGFQNGPVFEIDTSENEIYNRVPLITQTGTGRDISEKVMAEDLVYAGASQLGDDHGFAAYSRQFGAADYQYMYYRETNDWGGLFHRQGTSYSDLRQEFNYLDYYVGTTTGTNNKVFRFNTSGLAFGNSSNKVIKMDDMTEYDATPQSLSLIGAKGFGSASNYYTTSYNGTYSYYLYKGGEGGDVGIYGGDGADVSPTTSQPTSSPYNAFFGGDGGDVIINGGTKGSGWTQNEEEPGPADGNVVLDGTVVQVDSANFDVANNIRHIGDTETQIDFATNTIRLYAGSLSNEQLTVSGAGIILNEDGNSAYDFRVESDSYPSMLMADAGQNKVFITTQNTTTPTEYAQQTGSILEVYNSSPYITLSNTAETDFGLEFIDVDVPTTQKARFTWNTSGYDWYWRVNPNSSTEYNQMRLDYVSTTNSTLYVRGDVVAYATSLSDRRLKRDIEKLESPLEKIKLLEGIKYKKIDDDDVHLGFIAQDVENIIPEVVIETKSIDESKGDKELYKGIRYTEIIPYITEAIKEQQQIIDSQEKRIDELEKKLNEVLEKLS